MNRSWNLVTWSLVLTLAVLAAPGTSWAGEEGLDEWIDMDLADAPARQVLETFGRLLQAQVVLDETVGGTITITLDGAPAREALDRVCEQADCRWTLDESPDGPVLRIEAR